ncbi:telomere length and silencing protein 1 homolog [Daktulosphaira vitifoliae]|uniref:telomere length and silencing protein 1 homolog n=1 Tax=Daktulosphaira vitifoliae TaxID=58002 RepID=UPI0021AAEC81|nr:telomere length and silencing protein 1 homolog [Daktulosphaira vitifoliae]
MGDKSFNENLENVIQHSDSKVNDNSNLSTIFKKKFKDRSLRKKVSSDEEEGEEDTLLSKLEEMKTIQKLRDRPNGINIVSLALGEKLSQEEEKLMVDPFKVKTGGLINMTALKTGQVTQVDDAYDVGIGTQFSAETNKRDEDEEMMKYIDEQVALRTGRVKNKDDDDTNTLNKSNYCPPELAALQAVPIHLRSSTTHRSEEMLSNQMLSGIPEVDLGIEAKIKNIEATEEAKMKLIRDRHNKNDGPSQFVPTNMAVNFIQHNRFNLDNVIQTGKKNNIPSSEKHIQVNSNDNVDKRKKRDNATDDFHYERFKKQFRKY